jgi:hypothetical protein
VGRLRLLHPFVLRHATLLPGGLLAKALLWGPGYLRPRWRPLGWSLSFERPCCPLAQGSRSGRVAGLGCRYPPCSSRRARGMTRFLCSRRGLCPSVPRCRPPGRWQGSARHGSWPTPLRVRWGTARAAARTQRRYPRSRAEIRGRFGEQPGSPAGRTLMTPRALWNILNSAPCLVHPLVRRQLSIRHPVLMVSRTEPEGVAPRPPG